MEFEACPECDLLLTKPNPSPGKKYHCPRCGFLLLRGHNHSIERSLALSFAGLVLMIPANFLPMLGIKLFGNSIDGNLWTGVTVLFKENMWEVAILVLLSSVLLPLLNTALAGLISLHLYMNKVNTHITRWMRWLQHLNEWAMLEVYALGIIVACVKLSDMAEIRFGLGLYAFIALIIVNAMLANELDYPFFWQNIARLNKKECHLNN
jgi:paraquat-inducible protein A